MPSVNLAPAPEASEPGAEPTVVPTLVIARLITSRGGLPDHPIRPSIKTAGGNDQLFRLLVSGVLVVRESEFHAWYKTERARGKWPSQREAMKERGPMKKPRRGRPSKQAQARDHVLHLAQNGKWKASEGIAKLRKLLLVRKVSSVPERDTLTRLVDQLYRETGHQALHRMPRRRRPHRAS
jgi:hypothetical protein